MSTPSVKSSDEAYQRSLAFFRAGNYTRCQEGTRQMLAADPTSIPALVLQGMTGGFLGPAIAAISLGLVGHAALPQRLGRNQRFASTGSLVAAALMGLIGYVLSYQAIFLTVVALSPALFVALARIHPNDIHFGRACGAPHHQMSGQPARARRRTLWQSSGLLTFAICLFLPVSVSLALYRMRCGRR